MGVGWGWKNRVTKSKSKAVYKPGKEVRVFEL